MDFRSLLRLLALTVAASLTLFLQLAYSAQTPRTAPVHRIAVLEGEVSAGHSFERPIGNGLKVLLEPIASGWILRIIPATGTRGPHDYTEVANPPYQSVSPLLISTDFSFRSQDALAWNPRRFHYASSIAMFTELSNAYTQYEECVRAGPPAAAQMRLAEFRIAKLVSGAPEGELTILDAHLVQGTANQSAAAALIALHPNTSARQVDQPADGMPTPLGRLNWLKFRIRFDLPAGFHVDRKAQIDHALHF